MQAWIATLTLLFAGGEARTENFLVTGADAATAQWIAQYAESSRQQWAEQWLGRPVPPWPEPAWIHCQMDRNGRAPHAVSWPATTSNGLHGHKVWLFGEPVAAARETLAHEICHLLIATCTASPMPHWWEEGLASLADGPGLQRRHDRSLAQAARVENLPDLLTFLDAPGHRPDDWRRYGLARGLVQFARQRTGDDRVVFQLLSTSANAEQLTIALGFSTRSQFDNAWRDWLTNQYAAGVGTGWDRPNLAHRAAKVVP